MNQKTFTMPIFNDDASHTFRGFRLQALYIVHKILTSSYEFRFQPEGAEDLAVYDKDTNLLEAIQVKSGDSDFVLSKLKSSFFERSIEMKRTFVDAKILLVKFGPIGNELKKACDNNGQERQKVIEKLLKKEPVAYSKNDLESLFSSIEAVEVDEELIKNEINQVLQQTLTGIDDEVTFDLLSMWIYYASEQQLFINYSLLKEKILEIGKYLNSRKAYHDQWFTSIQPLENSFTSKVSREDLANSFYQGEAARFSHIIKDLDVIRPDKLYKMHQLLKEKNILFVHGISGQGKSTLCYRYLYDYYPNIWRFQINSVESRQDALKSALALSEHAKALKVPIIVFLDVSADDSGWEELVKSLSVEINIKVLIAIREEDWRQSRITGVEFSFNEIEIQFHQTEAEHIFNTLFERQLVKKHLNFDDAWSEFKGDGPLLEFIYLITQGGRLEERLQSQVDRLTEEVLPGDETLKVLRAISIGTASGAKVNVNEIVKKFNITPEKTFKRLEAEYLLRLDTSRKLISAVHPIRSKLLEQILIDDGYSPWISEVQTVLPLLYKDHVGQFLLHAFLNHFDQRYELLSVLDSYEPESWEATEGVVKSLLWLSVREFVEKKKVYIGDIYDTREGHFVFTLGADITHIGKGVWREIVQSPIIPEDRQERCLEIHNELGIENFSFDILSNWLDKFSMQYLTPTSNSSWMAFATIYLWIWKCNLHHNKKLPSDWDKMKHDTSLALDTLSRVATVLYLAYPDAFESWNDLYREFALECLQSQELVCAVEMSEDTVRANFISLDLSSAKQDETVTHSANVIHEKTIQIIDYLTLLFPEKKYHASQGYGHQIFNDEMPDDSNKNIPIENSYMKELIDVNAMFRRVVNNLFRPIDWGVYVESVLLIREEIVRLMSTTNTMLNQYFQTKKSINPLHKGKYIDDWVVLEEKLRDKYRLPSSIIDPWGFSDEDNTSTEENIKTFSLASIRYADHQKYLRSYLTDLGTFIVQASKAFEMNGAIGKLPQQEQDRNKDRFRAEGFEVDAPRLSWLNFISARSALRSLQKEFQKLFAYIVDGKRLSKLENSENRLFQRIGPSWHFFINHSNTNIKKADQALEQRFDQRKNEVLETLIKHVNVNETGFVGQVKLETAQDSLWVEISHSSAVDAWDSCFEAILLTNGFIRNQTSFSQTVIQWYWAKIYFVPVYEGYSINSSAIPFKIDRAIHASSDEDINPIQHIPEKLSQNQLIELGLKDFKSPIYEELLGLHESASKLMTYLLHLKEFKKSPDPDSEVAQVMLDNYIEQLNVDINLNLNQSIEHCNTLAGIFEKYKVIDEDKYNELAEILVDFWKTVHINDQEQGAITITLDEIEEWSKQMFENIGLITSEMIPRVMELELHIDKTRR